MPAYDEHTLMDDNRFIADIMCAGACARLPRFAACLAQLCGCACALLTGRGAQACPSAPPCLPAHAAPLAAPSRRYEFKQLKAKEGAACKLLFKKRMFRETDETVTEPQFVNLSYIQAQHDYLQVRRPQNTCMGGRQHAHWRARGSCTQTRHRLRP